MLELLITFRFSGLSIGILMFKPEEDWITITSAVSNWIFTKGLLLSKKKDWKCLLIWKLQNKSIAKYELGRFCEQYGLPPIAPSNKKKKNQKSTIGIQIDTQISIPVGDIPNIKNSKIRILKQINFTKNPSPVSGRGNP